VVKMAKKVTKDKIKTERTYTTCPASAGELHRESQSYTEKTKKCCENYPPFREEGGQKINIKAYLWIINPVKYKQYDS
jgi:hypothetical protein